MILVDANVLIDIVAAQSSWTTWSQHQLASSNRKGLAINPVIYAEIAPCFSSKPELDQFLSDFEIQVLAITTEMAYWPPGVTRLTGNQIWAKKPNLA